MIDPIQDLYQRTRPTYRRGERLLDTESAAPIEAETPSGVTETFGRGFDAGIEGIRTDSDYFKGLFNTITGDDEAAAINIQTAQAREARIAESLSGLETYKDFVDNPTLSGLLSQTAKIGGQVAPYALTTIMSGGSTALLTLIAKGTLTAGSRAVAKNIVKESFERAVKGEATPDEKDLAELAYRLAHRTLPGKVANKLSATGGAITGQLLEEYTLMSGANFGENLQVEGLSDQEAAYRALAVAAPQAVIGVAGERVIQGAIFNKLGKISKERGQPGSILAGLGKEIAKATGKGVVGESIAETAQEGLQIANVLQADPTYKTEEALLRLGEAAFSGAVGGGAMSGAGRTVTGSVQASGAVFKKANEFIQDAREQGYNKRYNKEQYGVDDSGYTTEEPEAHMSAQKRSFQDENTARESLWVAGSQPEMGATPDSITEIEVEGQKAYARYIPGRGTIVSKDYDIVQAVVDADASDEALQIALGYSAVKPADADISIEARDAEGNVVWAEATNEQGEAAARLAAAKQVPEGGTVERQSLKAALEERAALVNKEKGPRVRNIDSEDFEGEDDALDTFGNGARTMSAPQVNNIGGQESYKPRAAATDTFATTSEARGLFAQAFKDVDLSELGKDEYTAVDFSGAFGMMSDAFLRQAARAKRDNPDSDVHVVENSDGSHSIMQTVSPEADLYGFDSRSDTLIDPEMDAEIDAEIDAEAGTDTTRNNKTRSSPQTFIREALKKAIGSRYARQRRTKNGWVNKSKEELVTVNGKAINLIDLVKDGQRLFSIEQKADFTDGGPRTAQRNGVMQAIASLIEQGYEIRIGGYDIRSAQLKALNELVPLIENEEANIAAAALEWDIDADDPNLQGRLNELLQALDGATAPITTADRGTYVNTEGKTRNKVRGVSEEAQRNSPLDRLKRQRKKWAQEYAAYKTAEANGDTTASAPVKPPLLALMDVQAGFQNGKTITLGTLLNTTPAEPAPRDATYKLTNEDGFVVFEGNKQLAQEQIEASDQPYIVSKNGVILTDEEFANERNVGFNERVENTNSQGPVADRGEDQQRPIGFSEETQEATPDYIFEPEQENVGELAQIGLKEGTIASRVADIARRTLRLNKPISVLSLNDLLTATDPTAYFGDPKVAAYVLDVAKELQEDSRGGGRYIGFADAHVILIDSDAGKNELDTAMIVAHEIGHALFKEQMTSTLENAGLYNRLFTEFQKARDAKDAPAAYKGKLGFEEWYADQTANWAISEYNKDRKKGLVGAHFMKVARKLVTFYKAFSADMKNRFGKQAYTPEFKGYMDEVLKRRSAEGTTNSGARAATMQEKIIVRKMAGVIEKQQPGFAPAIMRQAKKIIQSEGFTPIYNFIVTTDSRMRKVGGNKLADMFYGRAQQESGKGKTKLGFVKAHALEANAWYNELENMIDGDLSSPEVRASIRLAFGGIATRDLDDPNAIAVRKWFDRFYDEYIEPSSTSVGRQRDYAPVVLNLAEVEQNPEGLIKLILAEDPEAKEADISSAVQKLVGYQQSVMDDKPITIKETNPARSAEKVIKLTKGIDRDKLQTAGFLEEPDVALMRYTSNMIKRIEWNNNTKDSAGTSIYQEELAKLSPEARKEAELIVHKYLGYTDKPLGPVWRAINSWGSLLQIVAILPLATLGSLPELAGPVIASKEFGAVTVGMKEIVNTVRNRQQARDLARDLGVVTSQSVANVMMSQAELDFMDPKARQLTDSFFRLTLLDTYTKFTREFASNMGVRFLMNHSNPETAGFDSPRYLRELDVTSEEIQSWSKSNQDFNTPEGKKVRKALQRFVESSTLRPNSAERPLWASDPRWALAWQLKGFFYSYGKVMLAGAKREASARLEGASSQDVNTYAAMTGAAGVFALMGIATMPLAMVGMELREYAKFGLAWAIPGIDSTAKNYFRTDDMSSIEYLKAAFDRSYAAGPATIASQAMQAADWGRGVTGAAAVVAGPTAETVERVFTEGFSSTFKNRMLPTGLL